MRIVDLPLAQAKPRWGVVFYFRYKQVSAPIAEARQGRKGKEHRRFALMLLSLDVDSM